MIPNKMLLNRNQYEKNSEVEKYVENWQYTPKKPFGTGEIS